MTNLRPMNTHPLNLTLRFLLEIAMLIILADWGWHLTPGWPRYPAAIGFPVLAAALWGIFRIPNDPKAAPVPIPGGAGGGRGWERGLPSGGGPFK